jgi:hypothetical protein
VRAAVAPPPAQPAHSKVKSQTRVKHRSLAARVQPAPQVRNASAAAPVVATTVTRRPVFVAVALMIAALMLLAGAAPGSMLGGPLAAVRAHRLVFTAAGLSLLAGVIMTYVGSGL